MGTQFRSRLVFKLLPTLKLELTWSLIIIERLAIENDQWRVWVGLSRIKILRKPNLAEYQCHLQRNLLTVCRISYISYLTLLANN